MSRTSLAIARPRSPSETRACGRGVREGRRGGFLPEISAADRSSALRRSSSRRMSPWLPAPAATLCSRRPTRSRAAASALAHDRAGW